MSDPALVIFVCSSYPRANRLLVQTDPSAAPVEHCARPNEIIGAPFQLLWRLHIEVTAPPDLTAPAFADGAGT
eukprot:811935-Rhodomonas_salina.1